MKTLTTFSSHDTRLAAKRLAKTLKPGTVIRLEGNLGSGKTTFIKGIAEGLGVSSAEEVTSPTFVLMHLYRGRVPVYHFDLYRLETEAELETLGFEEFLNDPSAICCIEWPEKAGDLIPANALTVHLEINGPEQRTLRITEGKKHAKGK